MQESVCKLVELLEQKDWWNSHIFEYRPYERNFYIVGTAAFIGIQEVVCKVLLFLCKK